MSNVRRKLGDERFALNRAKVFMGEGDWEDAHVNRHTSA